MVFLSGFIFTVLTIGGATQYYFRKKSKTGRLFKIAIEKAPWVSFYPEAVLVLIT